MLKFFKWLGKGLVKEMMEGFRSNARQQEEREMHDLNEEASADKKPSSATPSCAAYFTGPEYRRDVESTVNVEIADNVNADDMGLGEKEEGKEGNHSKSHGGQYSQDADMGGDVAFDPNCIAGESGNEAGKGHRGRKRKILENTSGNGVCEDGRKRVEKLAKEGRPCKILRSRTIASACSVEHAHGEGNAGNHEGKLNLDQSDIIITNVEANESVRPKLEEEKGNHKNEGEVGRITETRLLRNRIIGILKEAGWTIQYRPRKSKDYLDAVYVDHQGRTYWSSTLAYKRLKEMVQNGTADAKAISAFTLIPEDELSKLYRAK